MSEDLNKDHGACRAVSEVDPNSKAFSAYFQTRKDFCCNQHKPK